MNKCPVCGGPTNGDENLCPYCGSQLKLNKKQDEIKYQSSYTSTTTVQTTKPSNHYVPYPQNNFVPPVEVPSNFNNYGSQQQTVAQTRTGKNVKKALFITIGVSAVLFVFVLILAIIGFAISGDYDNSSLSDKDLKKIINTNVGTDNVQMLSKEYIVNATKTDGNKTVYKNDKCIIYQLVGTEYIEQDGDSEFYERNFYTYISNIEDAEYDGSEYNGQLKTDNFSIMLSLRSEFDKRYENFYVYDDETLERLDNLKINGYIFEVYKQTDDYGCSEYYYFSEPIDNDESYLFVNFNIYSEDCNINYKDIILHFDTEKTYN